MSELNITDNYLPFGELNIRYLEVGSGIPTLLLHALNPRSCAEEWLDTMQLFKEDGRHVFAMDMPGWGLSEGPKDGIYHFSIWIEAVKQFCDAFQFEKVDIVGRTMGGWVAALFAYQYPNLVRSLVLFNNAGLNARPPLTPAQLSTMPDLESLKKSFNNPNLAEHIHKRLHQEGRAAKFKEVLDYILNQEVREEWSLRPRLPEIHTPKLFAMKDTAGEMSSQYAIEGFTLAPNSRLFLTKGKNDSDSATVELDKAALAFMEEFKP